LPKKALPQLPNINIHKHGPSLSKDELAIRSIFANDIPEVVGKWKGPLAVGLHPWHVDKENIDEQLALVEEASNHESVVAIGEIGLDRLTSVPFEYQKEAFVKQLQIAANANKPVIVHCVKAHSDIISILKTEKYKGDVIFHGFNQNKQIAEQLLKNGFYLSFGQALLNANSNANKVFCEIPNDRFFLETDESEIEIEEVYKKAAKLKNTGVKKIKLIISQNYNRFLPPA
jgi:TatD DNase family protein